jgi:hypothetical protein
MIYAQVFDLGHPDASCGGAEPALVSGHASHLTGPATTAKVLANQDSLHHMPLSLYS